MNLFDGMNIKKNYPLRIYNTGSMYDLLTGRAVQGYDGKWYIHGGFNAAINGFSGKENTYKSTLSNSLFLSSMNIYSDSVGIINETEGSYDEGRLVSLNKNVDIKNSIKFLPGTIYDLHETFKIIQDMCEKKEKHRKEFTIETPFIDMETGKKAKAWIPTYICIDSFSEMFSDAEKKMISEGGMDDKKNQTIYMVDGFKKSLFIKNIRRMCETHGLCVIMTAHIGKNDNDMNSYGPTPKQMQFMKQSDKMKNVGSKFLYLTRTCSQIMSAKVLQDSNKNALYKYNDTANNDINEVSLATIRCKENSSGTIFPFIVSQSSGLLNSATHYNYLRNNGYYGLLGNKQKQQSFLIPDKTISRNSIREDCDKSYELYRALELTAQYLFIKENWNVQNIPIDFSMKPEQLYEKLNNNKSIKINDILNSEGVWKYNKSKDDREYMSIFDVLELIHK